MRRTVTISIEQLQRPQPGGIATYVRGLAAGLHELSDPELDVVGLGARGAADDVSLPLRVVSAPLGVRLLTRLWPFWPIGVPRNADVVHATSMAGPFGGGSRGAVHSVAMHDLLWRDEPGVSTPGGMNLFSARMSSNTLTPMSLLSVAFIVLESKNLPPSTRKRSWNSNWL